MISYDIGLEWSETNDIGLEWSETNDIGLKWGETNNTRLKWGKTNDTVSGFFFWLFRLVIQPMGGPAKELRIEWAPPTADSSPVI
jgi:hypothetical protein